LVGDESIVNCLQGTRKSCQWLLISSWNHDYILLYPTYRVTFLGHPIAPILATSGIDPVVRIWQPLPGDGSLNPRNMQDFEAVVKTNQRRMEVDPLDMFIRYSNLIWDNNIYSPYQGYIY
jgi:hypothetical protein